MSFRFGSAGQRVAVGMHGAPLKDRRVLKIAAELPID